MVICVFNLGHLQWKEAGFQDLSLIKSDYEFD